MALEILHRWLPGASLYLVEGRRLCLRTHADEAEVLSSMHT